MIWEEGGSGTILIMPHPFFVIEYPTKVGLLLGGYGDRIVGLISVKLMSKLLKRGFYILWQKENIKKYLNYRKYDYELLSSNDREENPDFVPRYPNEKEPLITRSVRYWNYLDKQRGLQKNISI